MGVARDEDVHVELSLEDGQALPVAPRHDLMAVAQPHLELAQREHLVLRILGVLLIHVIA